MPYLFYVTYFMCPFCYRLILIGQFTKRAQDLYTVAILTRNNRIYVDVPNDIN